MALSELIDRTIIYGGGSGVVVSSQTLQAQAAETMPLMAVPVPVIGITIGDVCTIIATTVVIGKAVLDYLTFLDRKRKK